jgi:hypothetical protein
MLLCTSGFGHMKTIIFALACQSYRKESPSYCPPFAGCSADCGRRRKGNNQPVAMLPTMDLPLPRRLAIMQAMPLQNRPRVPVSCMQCKGDVESRPAHTRSPLRPSQASWLIFVQQLELEFDVAYLKHAQSRLGCLGGGCPAVVLVALARFCWFLLMGIGQLAVV